MIILTKERGKCPPTVHLQRLERSEVRLPKFHRPIERGLFLNTGIAEITGKELFSGPRPDSTGQGPGAEAGNLPFLLSITPKSPITLVYTL